MLEELKASDGHSLAVLGKAIIAVNELSYLLKTDDSLYDVPEYNRLAILDSLADQIVTATGVGTFLGMNVPGALAEVNRSNYSKFEDGEPVFNENMKVMKGKDYTPPDLSPYI